MVTSVCYRNNHAPPWRNKNISKNYEHSTVRSENVASCSRTVLEDDTDTLKTDELISTDNAYCSNA